MFPSKSDDSPLNPVGHPIHKLELTNSAKVAISFRLPFQRGFTILSFPLRVQVLRIRSFWGIPCLAPLESGRVSRAGLPVSRVPGVLEDRPRLAVRQRAAAPDVLHFAHLTESPRNILQRGRRTQRLLLPRLSLVSLKNAGYGTPTFLWC